MFNFVWLLFAVRQIIHCKFIKCENSSLLQLENWCSQIKQLCSETRSFRVLYRDEVENKEIFKTHICIGVTM